MKQEDLKKEIQEVERKLEQAKRRKNKVEIDVLITYRNFVQNELDKLIGLELLLEAQK